MITSDKLKKFIGHIISIELRIILTQIKYKNVIMNASRIQADYESNTYTHTRTRAYIHRYIHCI